MDFPTCAILQRVLEGIPAGDSDGESVGQSAGRLSGMLEKTNSAVLGAWNWENWMDCPQDLDQLGFPSGRKLGILVGQSLGGLEGENAGEFKGAQIHQGLGYPCVCAAGIQSHLVQLAPRQPEDGELPGA